MSSFLYRLVNAAPAIRGEWSRLADDRGRSSWASTTSSGAPPTTTFTRPGRRGPGSRDILSEDFPQVLGFSGQVVFHVDHGRITDPANAAAIRRHARGLRQSIDVTAVSVRSIRVAPTISADGLTALSMVWVLLDRRGRRRPHRRGTACGRLGPQRGCGRPRLGGAVAHESRATRRSAWLCRHRATDRVRGR